MSTRKTNVVRETPEFVARAERAFARVARRKSPFGIVCRCVSEWKTSWENSESFPMKSLPELEIITKKGKPASVILPIKQYQEMLERLEDAEDVA